MTEAIIGLFKSHCSPIITMQIICQAANTDLKFLLCAVSVQLDVYREPSCLCSDGLLLTPIRVHLIAGLFCARV